MAVDFKLIGSRIKTIRKKKSITQEQFVEKLSYSVGYVSNMERGATKISLNTLSKIADLLNCDIGELVHGCSLNNNTYLNSEINELLDTLINDEKRIVYRMLEMYIKELK